MKRTNFASTGESTSSFRAKLTGGKVSLADYSGKNVLLFFQEGIACESCWTQIASFETDAARLKAAGIDAVVSITQDPAPLISRISVDLPAPLHPRMPTFSPG